MRISDWSSDVCSADLSRAIDRVEQALGNRAAPSPATSAEDEPEWAEEFWVPHRSELIRIGAAQIDRIAAERDYMRLHVGAHSYLLHQTISSLENRMEPQQFLRPTRSHIVRRVHIPHLPPDGLGPRRS